VVSTNARITSVQRCNKRCTVLPFINRAADQLRSAGLHSAITVGSSIWAHSSGSPVESYLSYCVGPQFARLYPQMHLFIGHHLLIGHRVALLSIVTYRRYGY
jgi:hypothetical protein